MLRSFVVSLFILFGATSAHAQYSSNAGVSAPTVSASESYVDKATGKLERRTVYKPAPKDSYGNAAGSQNDLAVDGAFDGQTVAVLHLYTAEGFDFELPKAALKQKGFSVYRWVNQPPSPEVLASALKKANQLWIISDSSRKLTDAHLKVIKQFFDAGHGVYIWGDNEPYYADANAVGEALLGVTMSGNLMGNQVVPLQKNGEGPGILKNHLLSTGLEQLYEGITIATVQSNNVLTPLLHGSANNVVSGFYDVKGKRAIFDGGFTRLYVNWNTAGTGRYVKNAAAWLANSERFGAAVVAKTASR